LLLKNLQNSEHFKQISNCSLDSALNTIENTINWLVDSKGKNPKKQYMQPLFENLVIAISKHIAALLTGSSLLTLVLSPYI
jgi:hypothetical protein